MRDRVIVASIALLVGTTGALPGACSRSLALEDQSIPVEARLPASLAGAASASYLDGEADDLLTAGLGIRGLRAPAPLLSPGSAIPVQDLRRNTIHYHYNALVNTGSEGDGGLGSGPAAMPELRVAGWEYTAPMRLAGGLEATLVLQVPDSFDPQRACIVAAPSSGSRGVLGAIGTVGKWALQRQCAVVYNDKGTGTGFYFFDSGESYDLWRQLQPAPAENPYQDSVVTSEKPYLIATRHAHSGSNPESAWGKMTLASIRAAFYLLNTHHRPDEGWYTRSNTLVIGASVSNGGNAVLRALEHDDDDWIDGVVAAEPSVTLPRPPGIGIYQENTRVAVAPRSLLDRATFMALYQPCSLLAESHRATPMLAGIKAQYLSLMQQRCRLLKQDGLLAATTAPAQAEEARRRVEALDGVPGTRLLAGFSFYVQLWESLVVTYLNAYGRYAAKDVPCGVGFAYVDEAQRPDLMPRLARQRLPTVSSGIVPVAGIRLIDLEAPNGPIELYHAHDANGVADLGYRRMKCLRELYERSSEIHNGIREVAASADLHGRPAIIVHGRSDHLIGVNHSSRPYVALNHEVEGAKSRLRYYEVLHAQHFDVLLKYPGFREHLVALHPYLEASLDIMYEHLTSGRALPPSQVIATTPRSVTSGKDSGSARLQVALRPGNRRIYFDAGKMMIP